MLHSMSSEDEPLSGQLWQTGFPTDPFAVVFRKHFAALRAAHQAQPAEGVLIAAVDGNGIFDAHAHLRLPPSGIAHLIVGRHERCDVVLSRDSDVSLRHLLLRATRGPQGQLQLRAIDLRSRCGLLSEDGKRCEAIASQGPLFLQVASYVVFLLPTGPSVKLATITIQSNSPQAGDLTSTHAVWSDQLERGILVGRDDRCSHGGQDEGNLSRVHLVLLSVDDEVWAIDTASTNGTRAFSGPPFRQLLLSGETQLILADALALRWAPALHPARA